MMSNATIMITIIIMMNFVESLESSVAVIRNNIKYYVFCCNIVAIIINNTNCFRQ